MSSFTRISVAWVCLAGVACAQCGPNGLALGTAGGRLGDPYAITLSGSPGAAGLLAFDLSGGPVATPLGPICLGLTPALQTMPFTLDAAGGFATTGMLAPIPALSAVDVFLQAAAPAATGYAVSNGVKVQLRSPRLYVVFPGIYTGFNVIPGSFTSLDVLTGAWSPVTPLPSWVLDVASIPELGWLAVLLGSGPILFFDGATGALVLTLTPPVSLIGTARIAVEGTTLYLSDFLSQGSASLRAFHLPSGAAGITVALPYATTRVVLVPGTGFGYAMAEPAGTVVPVDLATGSLHGPIATGIADWIVGGTVLYGLVTLPGGGFGLNAIDPSTNTTFFPAAVPIPAAPGGCCTDRLFRFGPGSTGPSLFVRDASTSSLMQFSPQTFTPTAPPIPLPADVATMELSNGGTEWIVVQEPPCLQLGTCPGPFAKTALALHPQLHTFGTIGQFQTGWASRVLPVRSASINQAFIVTVGGWPSIVPFGTDPAVSLMPELPLPINYVAMRFFVD
jgi:hypothetical protein